MFYLTTHFFQLYGFNDDGNVRFLNSDNLINLEN